MSHAKRPDVSARNKTIDRSGPRPGGRKTVADLSIWSKKRRGLLTAAEQEQIRQYNAEWARVKRGTGDGKVRSLICSAKSWATKHGLEFDLTEDWLREKIAAGKCEVTGLPFVVAPNQPFTPSLDRKVPGGPYTTENVQVVVWIYNVAKQDFSHEDVLRMSRALIKTYGDD